MASTLDQLIPVCLRDPAQQNDLGCVTSSITYWTDRLFVVVALVSFFYLIYGGFMMVSAFGNEQKYTEAKQTVLYAVIGMIVATLAGLIIHLFTSLLSKGL
jgi:hypothetical protein